MQQQKVRAYVSGKAIPLSGLNNPGGTILEVELHDGRTIQFVVHDDGSVMVRGWGNVPAKVGNDASLMLSATVQPKAPTHCVTCYNKLDCGCEK